MSRFVLGETKTIRASWWDEDEEVEIRKWTIARRDRLFSEIMQISDVGTQAGAMKEAYDEGGIEAVSERFSSEITAAQVPVLMSGIKSWTFKNEEGNSVPVGRAWLSKLDPDDADFIASEIWALNRGRTPAAQESFRNSD